MRDHREISFRVDLKCSCKFWTIDALKQTANKAEKRRRRGGEKLLESIACLYVRDNTQQHRTSQAHAQDPLTRPWLQTHEYHLFAPFAQIFFNVTKAFRKGKRHRTDDMHGAFIFTKKNTFICQISMCQMWNVGSRMTTGITSFKLHNHRLILQLWGFAEL